MSNIKKDEPFIRNILAFPHHTAYNKPIEDEMDGENMDLTKYIDRLDQDRRDMEQRLREDRQQMEQRITEERRLSEDRMEKRFSEIMEKMDKSIDKADEAKRWIIGLCLTTIVAIAAMVITVIVK